MEISNTDADTLLKALANTGVYFFLKIGCSFAVTSAKCKHSISQLRILKMYMRSTMTEGRLNGLAMLYVHSHLIIVIQQIICNSLRPPT